METTYIISITSIGDTYTAVIIATIDGVQQPSVRKMVTPQQVEEILTTINFAE
jgi:hypothetical protein